MATGIKISPFINVSGSTSYRVAGTVAGRRIRENFASMEDAEARRKELVTPTGQAVVTRLNEVDIRCLELAIADTGNSAREIIEAGTKALKNAVKPQEVGPLVESFLKSIEGGIGDRWAADLSSRLGFFVKFIGNRTTAELSRPLIAQWIESKSQSPVSRRNCRAAVSRFCSWLVERGHLRENPAMGISIRRPNEDSRPVEIFTPAQAKALIHGAKEAGILGHIVLTLYCGLRPSEADRLQWGQIDLARSIIHVLGRKRGSMPRVVVIPAVAHSLLAGLDRDLPVGKLYPKRRRRAVDLANDVLPDAERIVWNDDICRHTYASMRAAEGIPIAQLAMEMGNSPRVIFAHYRAPVSKADAVAFWGENEAPEKPQKGQKKGTSTTSKA